MRPVNPEINRTERAQGWLAIALAVALPLAIGTNSGALALVGFGLLALIAYLIIQTEVKPPTRRP